jgi:hypothetical protein
MIINFDCNHSFIVLATVITIVNYDPKTFIVQDHRSLNQPWGANVKCFKVNKENGTECYDKCKQLM